MSQKIRQLSQAVISQVAAGEIIERPSSVIKELFENALDAGANRIDIALEAGGKRSIRVDDNGEGIHHNDLILALQPHATSKIATVDDISHIHTFGFRGEALASIAHVSRLTLMSRQEEQGYQVSSFGVDAFQVSPCVLRAHTSVRLQDLYYNVPARQKFLKSNQTEYAHCLELIKKLAMAHPNITLHLTHNQKEIFLYKKTTQDERIEQILGSDALSQFLFIQNQTEEIRLCGYISHPHTKNLLRNVHFCYVNQRLVKDKIITHAVREAYKDIMHIDQDIHYILFIQTQTDFVDVNVHPTKTEIRFRDPGLVYQFIKQSLQAKLSEKPNLSSIQHHIMPIPDKNIQQKEYRQYRVAEQHALSFQPSQKISTPTISNHPSVATPDPSPIQTATSAPSSKASAISIESIERDTPAPENHMLLGHALAQLHGIYILAENETGLILIDMHAAHERILYERYKQSFAEKNIQTQTLMAPILLSISLQEEEILKQHRKAIEMLGFSLSLIGQQKLAIRSIPALLIHHNIEKIVTKILEEMASFGHTDYTTHLFHHILSRIACHKAFRAHDRMSIMDMNRLLRELEQTTRGAQCNHGRPTYFHISLDKLDQLFMRGE